MDDKIPTYERATFDQFILLPRLRAYAHVRVRHVYMHRKLRYTLPQMKLVAPTAELGRFRVIPGNKLVRVHRCSSGCPLRLDDEANACKVCVCPSARLAIARVRHMLRQTASDVKKDEVDKVKMG